MNCNMQTFKKEERLSGKKLIGELHRRGASLVQQPFRLIWMESKFDSPFSARIAIGVPKKNFPKAVDRNRIKRQIREVYRKNKQEIYKFLIGKSKQCIIILVYIGKTPLKYKEMESKINLILQRFQYEFEKNHK
jgi:ribonuclease P protein component